MIAAYKTREAAAAHSAHTLPTAPPCTGGAPTSHPPRTPRRMGRFLRILPGVRQRATAGASTPCVCPRQVQEPLCFYAVLNTARRTRIKCARRGPWKIVQRWDNWPSTSSALGSPTVRVEYCTLQASLSPNPTREYRYEYLARAVAPQRRHHECVHGRVRTAEWESPLARLSLIRLCGVR
jgi:hypothetical protein